VQNDIRPISFRPLAAGLSAPEGLQTIVRFLNKPKIENQIPTGANLVGTEI
jgi:hypothetical protein